MRRTPRFPALPVAALLALLSPVLGAAFSHVAEGDLVADREMPTLDGGRAPLLGHARASVFVFFRPNQDHSQQVLAQLAQLEAELAGRPVRFVAVTSDGYDRAAVRALVQATGIRMPVLLDVGDALYGELGVALHPVVGITGADHRLSGYQHFLKINMLDALRGRVRVALGEIPPSALAAILDPPAAANVDPASAAAHRRLKLARMLLDRGHADKAAESARAAIQESPGSAEAHAVLAAALAASGRCAESASELAAARKLDPGAPAPAAACRPVAGR